MKKNEYLTNVVFNGIMTDLRLYLLLLYGVFNGYMFKINFAHLEMVV